MTEPKTLIRVESCWFFFELRTATLIIAYPGAVISGFLFIASMVAIVVSGIVLYNARLYYYHDSHHYNNYVAFSDSIHFTLTFSILLSATGLLFVLNVALLVGVYQKKPDYIRAWMMCAICFNLSFFYASVSLSIAFGSIIALIPITLILVVSFYFWIVVRSYYIELKAEVGRPPAAAPATGQPTAAAPAVLYSNVLNAIREQPPPQDFYPDISISYNRPPPPDYKYAASTSSSYD